MTDYIAQADKFLADTGTTLEVTYLRTAPYFHGDKDSRDIYQFTLKNARGSYTSEFGNSLCATEARELAQKYRGFCSVWDVSHKEEARIKAAIKIHKAHPTPNSYDILAGLEKYEVSPIFENWASELGYDSTPMSGYPKIRAMHDACLVQYSAIRRMFTEEQMEQLQEIQ